jgi:hypothetical protein
MFIDDLQEKREGVAEAEARAATAAGAQQRFRGIVTQSVRLASL